MTDEEILAGVPDFMSINVLMKARAAIEGDDRIIYVEASREKKDQQDEIVLSKALKESADHFLKFGVVDLDHKSMPSVAKHYGIENPDEWAIGQPVDVKFDGDVTMVKARLFKGDTPLAHRANIVWEGLTKLNPPARYYASVGGAVLGREVRTEPVTKSRVAVITKTRWNNLALSLNPVNQHLSAATTTPVGTFAKSLGGFVLSKGLEAGYGTDSAELTGGSALRKQSLDGVVQSYFDFRNKLAGGMRGGAAGKNPGARELVAYASKQFGLSPDQAAEWCERFMRDLKNGLNKRSKS
jgi:hypothetical protein